MPFTFKLSKRLARMKRAATPALLAALVACELRVVDPSLRVQPVVVPTSVILEPSQTQQLSAYGQNQAGDSVPIAVTWTSSDPAVATVSAAGLVTGVAAGSATIRVMNGGKSASAAIRVGQAPVASVVITPDTATVLVTATLPLVATLLDSAGDVLGGRPITWASSDPVVATVAAGGLVTGLAAGTATITATSEGKSGSAAITVTAPPPDGPHYYVSPSGSDAVSCAQAQDIGTPKRTLNNAVGCLGPGTTLYIRGGTYAEALLENIPSGTSWTEPVTLKAYPGETVTLRPSASRVLHFQNRQSYIVIDGLILDGSNVSVDVVKITYGSDPATAAHHIRIMNGELKNAPGQGVLLTGPNTRFNEFINLKVHHNGGAVGNNNGIHGLYIEGPNNLVDNCDIYENAAYGVQFYSERGGADNNTIRNTKIHGNNKGLILASGTGNTAYNNVVYGNRVEGLKADYGASNAAIHNNTIYNNGSGLYIGSGSTNATVRNNVVWQSGTAYSNSGSGTTQDHNLLGTADPLFVNALIGDFRLLLGSPAIDAGTTIPLVPTDFDGVTRPRGPAYDLGAFEY